MMERPQTRKELTQVIGTGFGLLCYVCATARASCEAAARLFRRRYGLRLLRIDLISLPGFSHSTG
jgi:hypothetical protein